MQTLVKAGILGVCVLIVAGGIFATPDQEEVARSSSLDYPPIGLPNAGTQTAAASLSTVTSFVTRTVAVSTTSTQTVFSTVAGPTLTETATFTQTATTTVPGPTVTVTLPPSTTTQTLVSTATVTLTPAASTVTVTITETSSTTQMVASSSTTSMSTTSSASPPPCVLFC